MKPLATYSDNFTTAMYINTDMHHLGLFLEKQRLKISKGVI